MFFGILQRGMAGKSAFWDRETAIGSADIAFLDVISGILVGNLRHLTLQFAAYWWAICRILVTNLPYIGHVPHAGRKGKKARKRLNHSSSTTCAKRLFSRYLRPRAELVANTPLLHREFSELSWQTHEGTLQQLSVPRKPLRPVANWIVPTIILLIFGKIFLLF